MLCLPCFVSASDLFPCPKVGEPARHWNIVFCIVAIIRVPGHADGKSGCRCCFFLFFFALSGITDKGWNETIQLGLLLPVAVCPSTIGFCRYLSAGLHAVYL